MTSLGLFVIKKTKQNNKILDDMDVDIQAKMASMLDSTIYHSSLKFLKLLISY